MIKKCSKFPKLFIQPVRWPNLCVFKSFVAHASKILRPHVLLLVVPLSTTDEPAPVRLKAAPE